MEKSKITKKILMENLGFFENVDSHSHSHQIIGGNSDVLIHWNWVVAYGSRFSDKPRWVSLRSNNTNKATLQYIGFADIATCKTADVLIAMVSVISNNSVLLFYYVCLLLKFHL